MSEFADFGAPIADYADDGEPAPAEYVDPGDFEPASVPLANALEIQEQVLGQVEATAREAEAYFAPEWKPTREEWVALKAAAEQIPGFVQLRSAQQQENRGAVRAADLLSERGVPEAQHQRALDLAQATLDRLAPTYGPDGLLAQAALEYGAQAAAQEAQQVDSFARAAFAVAKAVRADTASLDIAAVFKASQAAMKGVSADHPGEAGDEIAVRAIVQAVREQSGRNLPRPLGEDYDIAARVVRELRGPQPQQQSTQNYRAGGVNNSVTGRLTGLRKKD